MKRLFLILLMQCSLFAFGQEKGNWKNMSFKEAAFTKTLNVKDKISQMETAGNK